MGACGHYFFGSLFFWKVETGAANFLNVRMGAWEQDRGDASMGAGAWGWEHGTIFLDVFCQEFFLIK